MTRRRYALMLIGVDLLVLSASTGAWAGCSCGFPANQRTQANQELWLNSRDQQASIDQHLPWGLPVATADSHIDKVLVQRDYVIGYSTDLT